MGIFQGKIRDNKRVMALQISGQQGKRFKVSRQDYINFKFCRMLCSDKLLPVPVSKVYRDSTSEV